MAGGKLISTGVEFPDATTQTTSGLPLTGGALTGAVTTTSTFDGRDVAADGVTADAALPKAGGTMTGTIAGFTSTGIDDNATSTAITIDASENVILTSDLIVKGTVTSDIFQQDTGTVDAVFKMKVNANNWSVQSSNDSYGFVADIFQIDGTAPEATLQLKASGDARLSTGNLVIGTSGKGIDFSATSDGSGNMTSEVLDDYEEGTWTLSLDGSTSDATISSGNAHTCTYTKIGRTVHITTPEISISAVGSGGASISGFPYPLNNQIGVLIAGSIYDSGDSNTYYMMNGALLKRSGGAYVWVYHSDLTTGWFRVSMTYQT